MRLVPQWMLSSAWLAWSPSRRPTPALAVMIGMTLAATAIDPSWWLHPLGPLTKNPPIAAILWVLWRAFNHQPWAAHRTIPHLGSRLEPPHMNLYLLLKRLHIVSSVLMVGTGLASAFICSSPTAAAMCRRRRW